MDINNFFATLIKLYEEQENLKITYKVETANEESLRRGSSEVRRSIIK